LRRGSNPVPFGIRVHRFTNKAIQPAKKRDIYTAESGSILVFQVFLGEHKFDRLGPIDLTGNVLQMASNKLAA
jgi:hypothetical protein